MARVLKQHFPHAHISMLIRRYTAELVKDNPAVDEALYYDNDDNLYPIMYLVEELRKGKYDLVFHTYPRFRAALITWLARIPIRIGTGYRWYSFLFNRKIYEHRKDALRHELEYNLNLLQALNCRIKYNDITPELRVQSSATEKVKKILAELGVTEDRKFVILHPGSGGSAREWSAEQFGELGRRLGQFPELTIIITGGKGEEELVTRVQSRVGSPNIAFVNQLSLGEYAALAKLASLFISNSTGTLHIAAAVGTSVIGLYPQLTSLSAVRWGPYTDKKIIFTPTNRPLNCMQCTGEKGSSCECMNSISVDEVLAAATQMLFREQKQYAGSLHDKSLLHGDNAR